MRIDVFVHFPRGASLEPVAVHEVPRRRHTVVSTGNHFYDQVGVRCVVSPNGALDSAPIITVDPAGSLTITPSADGLSADVFGDTDVGAWTVTFTAPADNPSTPELEQVSQSFSGSFSHSKATELGGSFSEVPRP